MAIGKVLVTLPAVVLGYRLFASPAHIGRELPHSSELVIIEQRCHQHSLLEGESVQLAVERLDRAPGGGDDRNGGIAEDLDAVVMVIHHVHATSTVHG